MYDSALPVLTGPNAVTNAWKVVRKAQSDNLLQQSISILQHEAAQDGLTLEFLEELLNEQ